MTVDGFLRAAVMFGSFGVVASLIPSWCADVLIFAMMWRGFSES